LQDVWQQLSSVVNLDEIEQMGGWLHTVARPTGDAISRT
jgi:hypothetical protein